MKKKFALIALILISSLNPHLAQAELAFTIPLIDVWSGTKKTYTTINNIYTFDPATTASIL